MKHLTTIQILKYVDGSILNGERTEVIGHLEDCVRCRKDVEFQKALGRVARRQPLVRPSSRFSAKVMQSVLPERRSSLATRILNNLGSIFAMMLVVGVLGYFLSRATTGTVSNEPSQTYQLFKNFSDAYSKVNQFVAQQSVAAERKVGATTSTNGVKVLSFAIVTLLVLAAVDRFVVRQFLKMKL